MTTYRLEINGRSYDKRWDFSTLQNGIKEAVQGGEPPPTRILSGAAALCGTDALHYRSQRLVVQHVNACSRGK
jgi:hypothetical protein